MSPITHLLASWTVASIPRLERRDRAIITLAGISPDIDGLGIVAELATRHTERPLLWWSEYHHVIGHNLTFGLMIFILAAAIAKRRLLTAGLAVFVFHLHLFCDLIGARGPEGYQWPIPYLYPYLKDLELIWSGQWALNAWPNFVITIILIAITVYLAWKRGLSPLEIISKRVDGAVVRTLRNRFGTPGQND
ncbi:MAG: metal-dependent hydrolase [Desulfobacterales bacterium]|jgi:hypothetical protein